MLLKVKTTFKSNLLDNAEKLQNTIYKKIDKAAVKLTAQLKTQLKSEISRNLVKWSGNLENSVGVFKKWGSNSITLGVDFDEQVAPYVNTHIGKLGTKVIKPRIKKFLTVPITNGPAYHTGIDSQNKTVADFPKLTVIRLKSTGEKFLVLKGKDTKWKSIFIFQLKKSVKVPVVVDAVALAANFKSTIDFEFKNIIINTILQGKI